MGQGTADMKEKANGVGNRRQPKLLNVTEGEEPFVFCNVINETLPQSAALITTRSAFLSR